MVDMSHVAGLVAAGVYPNPIPYADVVTTTTHKTMAGPRGGLILARENPEMVTRLNSAVFPGTQGGPLMHIIAAKAVCFKESAAPEFRDYQTRVVDNARTMAKVFMDRGFKVVSGGTDNHMFLVDLTDKEVTGAAPYRMLNRANISVNKIADRVYPGTQVVPRRLRIGTAATTRRGFGMEECSILTDWMCDILDDHTNDTIVSSLGMKVLELCEKFPIYSH